jgi:hypothetical protein
MKIVIQCAARKNESMPDSGFRTEDGKPFQFVANPKLAPTDGRTVYVHPDEKVDDHQTWRERLLAYNKAEPTNPLSLLPAFKLYDNRAYENLVKKFGVENVFILSAGWGLISADFFTPHYDITFSAAQNVKPHCRRRKQEVYADLCQLPDDGDHMVFLGGKDYLPLFSKLTSKFKGEKTIFFNSAVSPALPADVHSKRYITNQKTNWHYLCAEALISGAILP